MASDIPFEQEPRCEDLTQVIETLASHKDSDPRVAAFAHFIATRLEDDPHPIVATGFVMISQLAILDLQRGKDGYTGEPIDSDLVGLDEQDANNLTKAVPELARTAFGVEFGDAVELRLVQSNLLPPKEAAEGEHLTEDEIITDDIDDIDDAYQKIFADAKRRVMALDWQHFGIDSEEIGELFEAFAPLTLRNAPYRLPINFFIDDIQHERGLLLEMLPEQKKLIKENYWLGLTVARIPGDFATFARDHIMLKTPDVIAAIHKLDLKELFTHFGIDGSMSNPLARATVRIHTFMRNNPGIMK